MINTESFLSRYRTQSTKDMVQSSLINVLSKWTKDKEDRLEIVNQLRDTHLDADLQFDELPAYILKIWSNPGEISPEISKISEQERRTMVRSAADTVINEYPSTFQHK